MRLQCSVVRTNLGRSARLKPKAAKLRFDLSTLTLQVGNGRDSWIIKMADGKMTFDGDCNKAVQGLCTAVGGTVRVQEKMTAGKKAFFPTGKL